MGNVMCCGKREKNEVGANLKNSPRGEVTSTPLADFQTINDIEDRSAVTPYDNNREGRTEDSSHTRTSLKRPTNKTIVLDQGQGEASPSTIMNKLSSGKGIEQVTKQAKLYVRIFLDGYESIIKNTEDLGVSFKPLLEINVEGHLPYLVVPQNPLDNEELEKIINAPDNDVSMNNVSQNNIRNIIGEKENRKNFAFKVAKSFDILEEHIHSDINLVLKNEVIGFSNRSGQVEAMSNMPPEVIIGTSRVNVYKLQSKLLDQFFEGHLEFKHKGNNTVGFLKVNIAISKNPINDEEEIEKAHKDQIYENEEKTDKRYIWSNKVKQFSFLHPEAFKLFNATEEHIELANKIPLFRVCFDFNMETIKDLYLEARQTDNHLAVFQILMLLKRLAGGYNFSYIEDFFRHLGEEERYDFLPYVLSIAENNFYVLKQVVKFVCYHLKYIKESKDFSVRFENKMYEESKVMEICVSMLDKVVDNYKNNVYPWHYKYIIKDCILWSQHILYLLTVPSVDIAGKSPEETLEIRKRDYTICYQNCVEIASEREKLLKIIQICLNDSEVISGLYRLFRRCFQILSHYSNPSLNAGDLAVPPKKFAIEFKKIVIESNEGAFINFIKLILNKFQHYTELHINLLSILYQLTSLSDPHSLILLAKSLDLAIFKDGFDMFRGRLRGAQRTVNHLHLAVLANISELSKYKEEEETVDAILALIAQDLNAFYRITKTYKKRLEDFRKKKKYDVEVHELMTRIGVNITKHSTHCKDLMDSYYFDDIIEYLIIIGVGEQNENDEENFKGLDFIAKIKEKKKKSNIDEIKKTTASIVDNSLKIIINIMSSPNEISDSFSTKLADHDIDSADDLLELLDECLQVLVKYGVKETNLKKLTEELKNLFE